MSQTIDAAALRPQFPALARRHKDRPVVYIDGPGGTQVHESVIEAMNKVLREGVSNEGGPFASSELADAVTSGARAAMADMLGAGRPEEIVFGQNMTSLTFSLSRAIARDWKAGDEIILTRLDHDANVSPWLLAAEDRGVSVRWLDFEPEDPRLKLDELEGLISDRTRLLALTFASNAIGTITDVRRAVEIAHGRGVEVFVDAVHYAPHDLIDVGAVGCDFLACSAYKFFGPHTGVLYGRYDRLEELTAYKVRPAYGSPPGKWETGTQSFESLAGVTAAVDYLASLGGAEGSRRERIVRAMDAIKQTERALTERFLAGVAEIPGCTVHGLTDLDLLDQRTPTFGLSFANHTPQELAKSLGERGVFVWDGHFYAVEVVDRLGLADQGGLLRIGFVHYNTALEVDRVLADLRELTVP